MTLRTLRVGERVHKAMGIKQSGRVIDPVPFNYCTDGTYRHPHSHERAVYVRWDDGTIGWCHRIHLEPENN